MDKIIFIVIVVCLIILSVEDIKSRKVRVMHFVYMVPLSFICCGLNYMLGAIDVFDIVIGLVVTGVVALFGFVSKGLGMADIGLIFLLGLTFGGERLMIGMLISFGLIYGAAIVMLLKKGIKRTTTFPYIPFLSIGMIFGMFALA